LPKIPPPARSCGMVFLLIRSVNAVIAEKLERKLVDALFAESVRPNKLFANSLAATTRPPCTNGDFPRADTRPPKPIVGVLGKPIFPAALAATI